MTDEQLAQFLGLDRCTSLQREKVLRSITPARREVYERMAQLEVALNLWKHGLAPKPRGVLIDGVRAVQRRRRRHQGMMP
jgi:hypothetical protein